MNRKGKIMVAILGGVILPVMIGIVIWKSRGGEVVDPLNRGRRAGERAIGDMRVVGFVPPWLLGKTREYCQEVSHMVYLGIESDGEGRLVWDSNSRKINGDEYLKLKEGVKKCGGKNLIGFKQFDDEKLDKIFGSETALNNLTEQIKAVVVAGGFDGVNIDFEYQSSPTKILNEKFLDWILKLKKEEVGEVEVDVFVNTVIKGEKEKLEMLVTRADDLIVMAYDFHRPGMDYGGAVAPIGAETGEPSIKNLMEEIGFLGLDKKKITLAYPLYGYEWKTEGEEFGSKIKRGWYQVASYKRVKEIIEKSKGKKEYLDLKIGWDELSQTPWISYKQEGEIFQIYYDDIKSLKAKIDLAVNSGMGGVGFWALGYEGGNKEVWEMLAR